MARTTSEKSERVHIRIPQAQKAVIARAAALESKDMTDFILDRIMPEAKAVIEAAEALQVSERDFVRICDLLDNPPRANDRLNAAISALPKNL